VPWYAAVLSSEAGVPPAESIAALHNGATIVGLMERYGISRARFMQRGSGMASELPLYPDVGATLATLAARGTARGIFTSLPGTIVEPLLSATDIRDAFGAVIHAGNCRLRKPNGGGVLAALQQLAIAPGANVLYVGDRAIDAQTAKNAGVSFAWAVYGYERERPAFVTVELVRFEQLLRL
jgi:phosphoglycolate phosphatase